MKKTIVIIFAFVFAFPGPPVGAEEPLAAVTLPAGFRIAEFASGVPRARQLALAPDGTVYVGTNGDKVWALRDRDGDGRAESLRPVLDKLNAPNGVAFHDGALYVAEIHRLSRVTFPDAGPARLAAVFADMPGDAHHGVKYIRVGPDGFLYVPQGMPCNVCLPPDGRYGTIRRVSPDGQSQEIAARGIRNTVGFAFHPATGELWFTDNGRDRLGDDVPPDELNRISGPGHHFGFPYFHGRYVRDPDFGGKIPAGFSYTPPVQELPAHVASLGMCFYTGTRFPARYRNRIFIAEHGSWNRSTPIGYRISMVTLSGNKAAGYAVFADGFLKLPGRGRPVDVLVAADGSLLVSDDSRGVVYRITYAP